MSLDRRSALIGAGIGISSVVAVSLVASGALALSWPWDPKPKPEKTVTVQGSVVCSNVGSLDGYGGSPKSLTITVNGATSTVDFPVEVRSQAGTIFKRPSYGFYRQRVTIAKDRDKTSLSWKLSCWAADGKTGSTKDGSFDVGRDDLSRTICSFGGWNHPCTGREWSQKISCMAALLVPGVATVAVLGASYLKEEPDTKTMFLDMAGLAKPLVGALACFIDSNSSLVPVPTLPSPPAPIPTLTLKPIPPINPIPTTQGPAPKPTISNFAATVHGPGHVGVSYNVGWQAGRDPVVCHFYVDGAEAFTAQCGTSSSKQFTGLSPGNHSFYAVVTDRFGVASDPSPTLTRDVPAVQPPAPTPRIELSKGGSAPSGFWYSVVLSGFTPGSSVTVTCRDSVDPGGFWNQTFTIGGDGRAGDSTLCYSGDHPDHWVTGGGVESNHVVW